MSYTYFTIAERLKIEVFLQEKYKTSQIAKILNRHRSSIYRELKRCKTSVYSAKEVLRSVIPTFKRPENIEKEID